MNFFKNKHIIAAIIVTPVLAILGYMFADSLVREKPHAAVEGQTYPLVAKSNCRFSSGECDLQNLAFDAKLTVDVENNLIHLTSSHPLENAMMGFVDQRGAEIPPARMAPSADDDRKWSMKMAVQAGAGSVVRVALQANNTHYFGDSTMEFATYKTTFDKDFRKSQ